MWDDDTRTIHADSDTITADALRRLAGECGGGVIEPYLLELPGGKPGTHRLVVCADADEAAVWLVRHWEQSRKGKP